MWSWAATEGMTAHIIVSVDGSMRTSYGVLQANREEPAVDEHSSMQLSSKSKLAELISQMVVLLH